MHHSNIFNKTLPRVQKKQIEINFIITNGIFRSVFIDSILIGILLPGDIINIEHTTTDMRIQ